MIQIKDSTVDLKGLIYKLNFCLKLFVNKNKHGTMKNRERFSSEFTNLTYMPINL